MPTARDTPVSSSHPVSPSLHHGVAAEIKTNQYLALLILGLPPAEALDHLKILLLHLSLKSRKMKRNCCKLKFCRKSLPSCLFFPEALSHFYEKE